MGKLTIQEIAGVLVEKNGLSQHDADDFANLVFAVVIEQLQRGEQVKVRGLGTFKIVDVEARESVSVRTGERVVIESHQKVSFTPDTMMKELVNKPFSQFETVMLNDGVEFEDIEDDEEAAVAEEEPAVEETPVAEEEPAVEEPPVSEEEPAVEETPVAEEEPAVEEVPVAEEEPAVEEPPVAEEEPAVEEVPVAGEEPAVEEEPVEDEAPTQEFVFSDDDNDNDNNVNDDDDNDDGNDDDDSSSWLRWLMFASGVVMLMCLSAYGGYYYATTQTVEAKAIPDTVVVRDTVFTTGEAQAQTEDVAPQSRDDALQVKDDASQVKNDAQQAKDEAPVAKKAVAEEKPAQPEVDQYAAKDERVRLGAYRIVGTDKEVTILPGQTFYSVCRAHLGPDMECYVEVYNDLPRNPQLKAGQRVKIPKLELKKRRKQ